MSSLTPCSIAVLVFAALFAPVASRAFEVAPNGTIVQSTCNGGTLPICGIPVPMPATTSVGNTAEVHVPPALLGDPAGIVSFTVECVDNGNGGAVYRTLHSDGIPCSAFPCQASTVRLCEASIPVAGGTPLGGVVPMTMPPPHAPEPFTVQCVGSAGGPPVYQISDHSAVNCPGPAR